MDFIDPRERKGTAADDKDAVRDNESADDDSDGGRASRTSDRFWDMGAVRPRVYKAPDFSGHTVSTTEISDSDSSGTGTNGGADENADITVHGEIIAPRGTHCSAGYGEQQKTAVNNTVINNDNSPVYGEKHREYRGSVYFPNTAFSTRTPSDMGGSRRVVTSSYKRKSPFESGVKKPPHTSVVTSEYAPGGVLIKKITVRSWESDTEFYGRFTSDTMSSHLAPSSIPWDSVPERIPYFSYVPQYSHMNASQVEYYRWVRENIRHGRFPECDLPYIQLFVFELINLPAGELAAERAGLIADIWLAYRRLYPRLDGYLCEWLPDYCMINAVKMPPKLGRILHIIVPKAQFKEFFLDPVLCRLARGGDCGNIMQSLGRMIIEVSSDYDYKSSRYYADNADMYDVNIPRAVAEAVKSAIDTGTAPFSLDRIYKMTRDSYSGAIVSSSVKRRLDIEFCSFTRRADTRQAVTSLVKYAENKLRYALGIKAKLSVVRLTEGGEGIIDSVFTPLIRDVPKTAKEDEFMPPDYLKNYEVEDSGFDLSKAIEIEVDSWTNAQRLTGENYTADTDTAEDYRAEPLSGELSTERDLRGAYVTDTVISDSCVESDNIDESGKGITMPMNDAGAGANDCKNATHGADGGGKSAENATHNAENSGDGDMVLIKNALRAALDGKFRRFCRDTGVFEGELADRINTMFIEILGDVVIEDSPSGYIIIEDYRKDVSEWI